MKTVVLMMIVLANSFVFAGNGDEKKEKIVDSTKTSKDETFTVNFVDGSAFVTANGEFGEYASISLATNRGSDIFFEFLKDGNNSITFDLSVLDEGSYFIVLNSNDEVRIKRFQLK